ncbi:ubiquitin-like domain-containing protein [Spongisporangium articulatum]|uniref:Ubiquitin-like domain-containing protein n=1 Tax=Spongisporangium articulatum TaxID=3362603 RepID=A0ABW8AQT7_9ACTN
MRALVMGTPGRIAVQAALLTAVIGGSVIYASAHKDVTLTVDGRVTHVRSMSGTVGDFLRDQDIRVGARDIVAPAQNTPLGDGGTVVVRYARPLTLTVDGKKQTFWTTDLNVDSALNSLGVRALGAQMSASRSQPIGRGGLTMWVSTPKKVKLVVGGKKQWLTTTAPNVSALLTQKAVVVNPLDKLSAVPSAPLVEGQTVSLTRIERKRVTRAETVAFPVVKKKNNKLYTDQTKILKKGKAGKRTATYIVVTANGKVDKKTLVTAKVLKKPVTQVMQVGTKSRPFSGGSVGGDVDSLNWKALAKCESGGNPKAVNPAGYYGLYQFSLSTWRSVGGSGNPVDAGSDEQTYRAKLLYKKAGSGQWGCGAHLYD